MSVICFAFIAGGVLQPGLPVHGLCGQLHRPLPDVGRGTFASGRLRAETQPTGEAAVAHLQTGHTISREEGESLPREDVFFALVDGAWSVGVQSISWHRNGQTTCTALAWQPRLQQPLCLLAGVICHFV
ncbi:unnamed protein product [Protopolystoma xenopodis]|uniref:Uncharacterized protein n=1 Tax=Protopolystoma xenopodis TaxID=117903 RepID=A0A448X5K0_9PLAT|nr:unnamed protein product [Protopolystoma xenopodis]